MAQYSRVKTDFDKPEFNFILLTNENVKGYMGYTPDYYLYYENELDVAMDQLRTEYSKGIEYAFIGEIVRSKDGSYRVTEMFTIDDNQVYCADEHEILHFNWYVHAGNWLNPRGRC